MRAPATRGRPHRRGLTPWVEPRLTLTIDGSDPTRSRPPRGAEIPSGVNAGSGPVDTERRLRLANTRAAVRDADVHRAGGDTVEVESVAASDACTGELGPTLLAVRSGDPHPRHGAADHRGAGCLAGEGHVRIPRCRRCGRVERADHPDRRDESDERNSQTGTERVLVVSGHSRILDYVTAHSRPKLCTASLRGKGSSRLA